MSKKILIAPSILGADYGRLNESLKELESFSDWFHVDVMDGNFVKNLTIGACVVAGIKTKLPLDCHLMINNPHLYIEDFAKAGASSITIHAEASRHLPEDITKIKELGCRAGVSISPDTSVDAIAKVLPMVDMVLIMSVRPGFGGQSFMPEVLEKVKWLREHFPDLDIEIDGGINDKTAPLAIEAGANILVAGSYILKNENPEEAANKLRNAGK
ncbi:ribulose-phosphate 3-epimerase [Candidatus Peregrinibacteria bacterium]|nr:ribulose-phosphate 3-epimerase [Candidatus Peregrinibacteria bacterium]